jgi:peptide/nickel transport system substrate-binding protein
MSNRSPCSNRGAELLSLLLLVSLLIGCAEQPDAVLRVGLSSAPATLDPRHATDAAAARLCRLLYASPVDFDAAFRPQPALMTWEMHAPEHYVFRLRGEASFHDGTPIRAEDVAATYRSVLDPAQASPFRGALAHIISLEATSPKTLEVRLSRPDPLFPGLLTLGVLPARELEQARRTSAYTGSGGFRLAAEFNPQHVQLVRQVDGQRVDFLVVPNETTRALKVSRARRNVSGIDCLAVAPTRDYGATRERHGLYLSRVQSA